MFQKQLSIYFLLIASFIFNLFQGVAQPPKKASTEVMFKNISIPAQEQEFLPRVFAAPLPAKPQAQEKYELDVVMDYAKHFLTVEQIITYPNHTNTSLNSLTLAVPPNLFPNTFDLIKLSVDGIPSTDYNLNEHRLEIPLQTPLEPEFTIQLTLRYTLALPYLDQFNTINSRVFGYTDVQTNLTNWYPFVVPFINGEWVLHEPCLYGDYLVYPVVDYKVNLLFLGEENAPVVAASGSGERIGAFTRYTLEDGRAFAFSMSPHFKVSTIEVGTTTISSYYLPAYRKPAEAAMQASAQAIQLFAEEFGEYPRSTYSIVQADLSDSREFSGLSFISRNFYQLYDGTAKNYLTYASVHSVAHQWWFDQVGNDQAMEPWLDEALATYSELLYFENIHPDLVSYWQTSRVDFFRPQGKIDTSIYNGINHDVYRQAVYFNGVYFLSELRKRIGEIAFRELLRDYYQLGNGHMLTKQDFFNMLDQHTDVNYSDLVDHYFDN